jgi:hypothetical protein
MRKLATIVSVFGFIAFAGMAHAEDKAAEKSVKTETGTTVSGQKKTTKTEKVKTADGSTTETKTEVVAPKHDDAAKGSDVKRADAKPVHADGTAEVSEKTETGTTLTGNKKTTKTKKVEGADGSKTETKTTTEVKK